MAKVIKEPHSLAEVVGRPDDRPYESVSLWKDNVEADRWRQYADDLDAYADELLSLIDVLDSRVRSLEDDVDDHDRWEDETRDEAFEDALSLFEQPSVRRGQVYNRLREIADEWKAAQ